MLIVTTIEVVTTAVKEREEQAVKIDRGLERERERSMSSDRSYMTHAIIPK